MHLRFVEEAVDEYSVTTTESAVSGGELLVVAGSGDATLLCGASSCGA